MRQSILQRPCVFWLVLILVLLVTLFGLLLSGAALYCFLHPWTNYCSLVDAELAGLFGLTLIYVSLNTYHLALRYTGDALRRDPTLL